MTEEPAPTAATPADVNVRQRLPRDVLLIVSLASAYVSVLFVKTHGLWIDSHAYWMAWKGPMYGRPPGTLDAYLYSPAFAQLLWPATLLAWPVFAVLYALVSLGMILWLVRPLGLSWAIPVVILCTFELLTGNINWLFAWVCVVGLRYPAVWALPALTKITPCVGPIWFLVRREWRNLAISLSATAGVVAASALVAPALWREWLDLIAGSQHLGFGTLGGSLLPPPIIRIPLAWLLVAWGAWRGRPWVLPVGMLLASPVFGFGAVTILAALPRLQRLSLSPARGSLRVSFRRVGRGAPDARQRIEQGEGPDTDDGRAQEH